MIKQSRTDDLFNFGDNGLSAGHNGDAPSTTSISGQYCVVGERAYNDSF
jgi:hypothetical protein